MPDWFRTWENINLITFDDKNGDGRIQYVADPDVNELNVDRDIIVLANPEIAQLPNWVIALIARRRTCRRAVYRCRIVAGDIYLDFP